MPAEDEQRPADPQHVETQPLETQHVSDADMQHTGPERAGPEPVETQHVSDADTPYVDTQHLSDVDVYVYETVATLEYARAPVTRDQILSVTDRDNRTVSQALRRLTQWHVLLRSETDAGPCYVLARRDWSVTPDIPRH